MLLVSHEGGSRRAEGQPEGVDKERSGGMLATGRDWDTRVRWPFTGHARDHGVTESRHRES